MTCRPICHRHRASQHHLCAPLRVMVQDNDAAAQIYRAAYVAQTAGCMPRLVKDLSRGDQVEPPMGIIVMRNINPSVRYGIGG